MNIEQINWANHEELAGENGHTTIMYMYIKTLHAGRLPNECATTDLSLTFLFRKEAHFCQLEQSNRVTLLLSLVLADFFDWIPSIPGIMFSV